MVHQGALGDFLLILPAIEAFHCAFPHVQIDFWSRTDHCALVSRRNYFGSAHSSGGLDLTPFYHEDLWQEAPLPPVFCESEEIFIFGQDGAGVLAERMAVRLERRVQWVRSFPAPGEVVPVSHYILEQFRRMGFALEETPVRLVPFAEEALRAESWLSARGWLERRPVMIHPGSGGIWKVWPLKNWWALLDWLNGRGVRPVLMTLGPADGELRHFASEAERKGVTILDQLSLPRLAAMMAASHSYVGCDSGVSHLAAMMGVPSSIVFGPTDASIWAPQGPNVCVIQDKWSETEVLSWSSGLALEVLHPHVLEAVEKHFLMA